MGSFKEYINDLYSIVKSALKNVKSDNFSKKIDTLIKQNETIATGMIAVSDKLEDFVKVQNEKPKLEPKPMYVQPQAMPEQNLGVHHTIGMPQQPRMAPQPEMNAPPIQNLKPKLDMPPPPPSMSGKKRGGLF